MRLIATVVVHPKAARLRDREPAERRSMDRTEFIAAGDIDAMLPPAEEPKIVEERKLTMDDPMLSLEDAEGDDCA